MIFDAIFRNDGTGKRRIASSEDLADLLEVGNRSAAGKNVTPDSAMRLAAVFACVRVLAESVGQLPCHLLEQKGREKNKAEDHPLFELLHYAPNRHQTPQEFWEFLVACMALRGNAYAFINWIRNGTRIGELVPLLPGSVRPELKDGELRYLVRDGKEERVYSPANILHLKLFPLDGLIGASPVTHAREAIGLGLATEEHGARLFSNGARPGGVLEHPASMSEEAYNRLKTSFNERHMGGENAHRVALLEEGTKFSAIGFSAEDAQFLETRKYQRSEIAGIFRVPPHLIGDLEKATFSNIEHQGLDFVVHALVPYLTRIEQRIRLQLLAPSERARFFAKFNVAGLLRGDMAARSTFYREMINVGVYSPNEVREFEDRNPREGGDIYLTPLNMAVNGQAPEKETTARRTAE